MRRLLPVLFLPLVALLVAADPPKAKSPGKGTNYAFLVGCAGYDKAELKPIPDAVTVNDVIEFKKALLATGFADENIVMLHDQADRRFQPECDKITRALDHFLDGLTADDTVVVVLSGHGVHYKGDKFGYFCPLDAKVSTRKNLLPMDGDGGVYPQLAKCKAGRKVLIANACRNDPAVPGIDLAGDKVELADEYPDAVPKGIAAIYSCEERQKSYFDPARKRSLFMLHLTDAWTGGASLEDVFTAASKKTRTDAFKTYEKKQYPVVKRQYEGEWVIASASAVKPKEAGEVVEEFEWKVETRKRVVRKLKLGGEEVEFVKVPAGSFQMGSPETDKDADPDEKPRHKVTFTKDLWVAKYPVTKGQFAAFVKADGYTTEAEAYKEGGWGYDGKKLVGRKLEYTWKNTGWPQTDRHPVVNVTFKDAEAYCGWASKHGKAKVRLLTEAEYEYANRGGTDTVFFTGDNMASLTGFANVADNSAKATFDRWKVVDFDDGYVFTSPVGRFESNGFGLHDTTGNVWSWCADWYDDKLYKRGDLTDPKANASGEQEFRAVRGGSWTWDYHPVYCRVADRNMHLPTNRLYDLGFRICVVLD